MAYENDILTRNDDDELSVRVVQSTGDNPAVAYDDVYTRDDNGKLAVRVVGAGGGGGDTHNKGYFATPEALRTAYPTAQPGDFAIVESTDTVWVWDSDTNNWKDGDTKGQVISVNNQTGAVTLTASDVGAATAAQGAKADTAVQPSDLATVATTGAYSDLTGTPTIPAAIQVSTMPTAAAGELDKIYQFVGTTDANYTNGYFYKCVSDGQDPATYSWTQTDVQPQGDSLPSQTGQSGKFLTTNGTSASWEKALQNLSTGTNSLSIGAGPFSNNYSINIGPFSSLNPGSQFGTAVGVAASSGFYGVAYGYGAVVNVTGTDQSASAIQLGSGTNTVGKTVQFWDIRVLDADGTIPTDRLPNAINKYSTMPTAASTNVGWIVQFTGTTDSTYTHGYIYECKAQGTDPETYAWEAVEVQAGGGGGLPDQTGNSGKFLTTDGTDASWSDKPLANKATRGSSLTIFGSSTAASEAVNIGYGAEAGKGGATSLGFYARARGANSVALGYYSSTGTNADRSVAILGGASNPDSIAIGQQAATGADNVIQIGRGTNSESGTMCVGVYRNNNAVNYKLLDNDGTIPAARHATLPAADGTYTLQLVIADGVPTLSWVAV